MDVVFLPFYLPLIILIASAGCSSIQESFDYNREKYSVKNWVKSEKYKKHVLENKKKNETVGTRMAEQDKESLENACTDCHNLKRVFLKRSSLSSWENLLIEDYHSEMELDYEEKSHLLKIFQKYLSVSHSRFLFKKPT